MRYSIAVTTPKLPPPPRSPHRRSAFSSSLARTKWPSAVTMSKASALSQVSPKRRPRRPKPPPSVSPAAPVCETVPAVVANPNAAVSWSRRPSGEPASRKARFISGSTRTPCICCRSMTSPPSQVDFPEMLCPPERTAVRSLFSRAKSTARRTSAVPVQQAMSAGFLSNMPFHTRRRAS
jgi:hypothetical protein